MRLLFTAIVLLGLTACAYGAPSLAPSPVFQPAPGQGQYIRPAWLAPEPTPRLPNIDLCQAQTFAPLIGMSEGAIYIPALPGAKRIIRPAFSERIRNEFLGGELETSQFVEVETYLPGQQLYAPTIQAFKNRIEVTEEDPNRLTIELDREGFVQDIRCG